MYTSLTLNFLSVLEEAGRTCWKSEEKITENSSAPFVKSIMSKNHESVIEHMGVTVRMITDRGVSHELVRHRLASYSQESTRYANYSKDKFGNEITVILPVEFYETHAPSTVEGVSLDLNTQYHNWVTALKSF